MGGILGWDSKMESILRGSVQGGDILGWNSTRGRYTWVGQFKGGV